MNSEIPQIPESNNNDSIESVETQPELNELEVESTFETFPNTWSDENISDVIDVNIESETESVKNINEREPELSESELVTTEPWIVDELLESAKSSKTELLSGTTQTDAAIEESESEPELFVDQWLDESLTESSTVDHAAAENLTAPTDGEIADLEQQKRRLHSEIETLKAQKAQMLLQQSREVQENIGRIVEEGIKELKERKTVLQIEIEKLERRQERINQEMRTNFVGSSQELAVRVQGFKNYLVGSLQDLATAAERLELSRSETQPPITRERERSRERDNLREGERFRSRSRERETRSRSASEQAPQAQFTEPTFAEQTRRIRQLLDRYRNSPDYYGSPWQLRRTFEPVHAKKVQEWFFTQGGRGAVDSMGSRLQNILVASAVISVLHNLYGDRTRTLLLTDTPENLGEWRRGLQDCLGISRTDFGSNSGVVLFDSPDVLVQRAERLVQDKLLPLIIIDESQELLNLAILKFPLWLAFASGAKTSSSNYLY
jgi:hypothetical protein